MHIIINGLLAIFLFIFKKLDLSGAIAAWLVGICYVRFGSWQIWTLLILFFASSILISLFKKVFSLESEKVKIQQREVKSGRNASQVLMNSLPGLICLIMGQITNQIQNGHLFAGIAIAGSTADTWASEIGILSKDQARYIISRKPVPTGLSGGVSKLGNMASLVGASLIAFAYWLIFAFQPNWSELLWIILGGILCSIIDSIMGEFLQAIYQDSKTGNLYESPQTNTIKIRGIEGLNNNIVNLSSNLLSLLIVGIFV